ncbi:MAG: hypothetical protein ACFB03_03255 [Paracoccaceae bacterium]
MAVATKNNKTKGGKPYKALVLDVDYYDAMLDRPEMTPAQRKKYLEDWWAIMVGFIDLGWAVEAAQTSCGQDFKDAAASGEHDPDLLDCIYQELEEFEQEGGHV